MGKVANQRSVKINKEACSKKDTYAVINLEALEKASCDLNGVAFKLWVYFSKNQDAYEVDMWTNNLEKFGIPNGGSYDRAWKELKDKGYLTLEKGKTKYEFHEIPLATNESIPTKMVVKESIPTKTELDTYQNGGNIPTKTDRIPTKMVGENITYNTKNNTNNITDTNSFAYAEPVQKKEYHDLYEYIRIAYTDKLNDKYLNMCFDGFNKDIMLHIFKYDVSSYEWLDSKNTYKDDKARFNTHLKYIKNKLYSNEIAEWETINMQHGSLTQTNDDLVDCMNILYQQDNDSSLQKHTTQEIKNAINIYAKSLTPEICNAYKVIVWEVIGVDKKISEIEDRYTLDKLWKKSIEFSNGGVKGFLDIA